jgi:multisubunit Na+/H+ antiporter MnhC subunit
MGFIYVATGFLIWKSHPQALKAARSVFLLNFFIFLMISILYLLTDVVAVQSVIAMTFRTGVWLVIFMVIRFDKKIKPEQTETF